jgi:hypothetical protein
MSSRKLFNEGGNEAADRATPEPRGRRLEIEDRDSPVVVAVRVRREAAHLALFLRHALRTRFPGNSFAG